jgi:hypothetical protein
MMTPEQSLKRGRPESASFANARASALSHRRRALATKKDLFPDKSLGGRWSAPGRAGARAERPNGIPWTPAPSPKAQGREAIARAFESDLLIRLCARFESPAGQVASSMSKPA